MWLLIIGLIVFFAPHVVRMAAPSLRQQGLARLGEGGWKGVYSLLSFAGLILIVFGWIQYRLDAPEIYAPPSWGQHVTALLVLVAFILIFAAYMPTGRIKATLQHPFLLGVMAWSFGHLLANGDLASLLLFGSFLVYAIWNRIALSQRGDPGPVFHSYRGDVGAVAIGIIATGVFAFWLHGPLFGVAPF